MWEGIGRQEKTSLVIKNGNLTAHRYIDGIVHPSILPFLQQQPRGVIYRHVTVNVLPWCPCSPDNRTPTGCHGSSW